MIEHMMSVSNMLHDVTGITLMKGFNLNTKLNFLGISGQCDCVGYNYGFYVLLICITTCRIFQNRPTLTIVEYLL